MLEFKPYLDPTQPADVSLMKWVSGPSGYSSMNREDMKFTEPGRLRALNKFDADISRKKRIDITNTYDNPWITGLANIGMPSRKDIWEEARKQSLGNYGQMKTLYNDWLKQQREYYDKMRNNYYAMFGG